MKRWLQENSLSIVLAACFLVFIAGQSVTGYMNHNEELQNHGSTELSYGSYLASGAFIEATFENWESEFLQMAAYVLLTVFLRQKGSAESKKLRGTMPVDQDPRKSRDPNAPWPVRRGGWVLKVYENSLGIALGLLFLMSFLLHAYGGARAASVENIQHGEQAVSMASYMTTSQFWFESFQNWQSEFLAVFAIVVLTIFLRQRGSPESKPVNTPYDQTGSE